MAIQFWKDMSIIEDDLQLAGHGKSVAIQVDVAPLDTTPLSTSGYTELIGGLKTATVDLEFMQDFAVGSVDDTLWSNFGSAGVVRTVATASADGSVAYTMKGVSLSYAPLEGSVGDLAMGRVSGSASGSPLVRGKVLHPSTARTSSSTGTGRQLGAVVAGKSMYAALHVLAASGSSPTLDVIVQSDDNAGFTSPTSRITFTQATTTGSQWGSVAGAVTDDYWRVSYTIGGSTPSFTFVVVAGIL